MSSDLDRLLREGWNLLPDPDPEASERARERALAALAGRRSRRLRSRLLVAGALLVAVVLGVGIGASVAPSGSAAEGPVGFGFLPESGWYVVQNGARATPDRPALAIASTVPLAPGDGSSIVPYATLQALPPEGIVLVASFIEQGPQASGSIRLPARALPLRVEDALVGILYGAQIRPEQPLGQYQLGGKVNGYAVDVHLYFGTPKPSEELLAEAQRQLDRLVVAPDQPASVPGSARPSVATSATQSVTMAFVRYYDNACRCYKARLSGRISSGQAGEYVVVMRQYCGRSFATAVAGATTGEGGFWEAELPIVSRPEALASETYRARWNGHLSEPVTFRGRVMVSGAKTGGARQIVTVFTSTGNPVSLSGRQVVLQRQVGGGWTRIATARLAPHRVKYSTFVATFRVPQRGWTLRAVVPSKAAAPCFTSSASERWRS